jgi:hypothetical protein
VTPDPSQDWLSGSKLAFGNAEYVGLGGVEYVGQLECQGRWLRRFLFLAANSAHCARPAQRAATARSRSLSRPGRGGLPQDPEATLPAPYSAGRDFHPNPQTGIDKTEANNSSDPHYGAADNVLWLSRRCSNFSAVLHRFQPSGLLDSVTGASRGIVTTLPSWPTAPIFRSLRIGELAMTRAFGGSTRWGKQLHARVSV